MLGVDIQFVEPLHDKVLIEITEPKEEKTPDGIYIPSIAQKKNESAWEGVVHKIGKECEEGLKIGDKVIFDMSYAENLNNVCVVVPEENILAKIKD